MVSTQHLPEGQRSPPALPPRPPPTTSDHLTQANVVPPLPPRPSGLEEIVPSESDVLLHDLSGHSTGPTITEEPMKDHLNDPSILDSVSELCSSNSSSREEVSLHGPEFRVQSPTAQQSHIRAETIATKRSSFPELSPDEHLNNSPDPSQESNVNEDEMIDEIEELEVYEFLRRSSKYLDEVHIQPHDSHDLSPPPIPKLTDFRSASHPNSIDWIGFLDAVLLAQLERYCPNGLCSNPTPAAVSMSQIKAQATRSYVTIFPELWHIFSGNQISSIYRWENPRRTAFYLSVYYLLWLIDMIPSFIVGYGLYLIITRQLNPPTASQLKQEVNQRHQLGKQAEVMSTEGLFGTKIGTAGSIAKGMMANSSTFAGVAIGANPVLGATATSSATAPHNSAAPLPKMTGYRGIYTLSRGLYTDYGLEIQTLLADLADVGEKIRNLYLWRRPHACRRTTFMLVGVLLYTLMISQKWLVKNFLGWLGIEFFFVLGFTDKHPKFRKALNPVWLILYQIPTDSEFAIEILQERGSINVKSNTSSRKSKNKPHRRSHDFLHKKSRSVLSFSSDSKSVGNSFDPKPLDPSPQSKRESVNLSDKSTLSSVRNALETDHLKQLGHKLIRGSTEVVRLAQRVYEGGDKNQSKNMASNPLESNVSNLPSHDTISSTKLKTFATLCGKVPGNLVASREQVSFEPMKGFRTITTNIKASLSQSTGERVSIRASVLSPSSSPPAKLTRRSKQRSSEEAASRVEGLDEGLVGLDPPTLEPDSVDEPTGIVIPFAQIVTIKKVKRSIIFGVGFRISDGIEFQLEDASVISFDNIINRDQYFNELLILSRMINKSR